MKRVKDDVKEVASGFDCGITVGGFRISRLNDIIESYVVEKTRPICKSGGRRKVVIGVCHLELFLHGNFSLKGKRQVLQSLVQRARKRFNISIAEVDDQDLWQKAVLGICAVGNDRQRVNSTLDQVVNFIENTHLTDVADSQIEIINV